jgi:hypothetical protein
MPNRILHVELRDRSVVPAEAEVHVLVFPERLDTRTEARGRLMGPRCRYASTVEVAYHLRPLLVPTGRPAIGLRALIPEANLWSPEAPHLYLGPVELWQDGERCDVVEVRHGLRHCSVGPRGLRVNGRLTPLRGREVNDLDEARALALRQAGTNLVVAPVAAAAAGVWEVADRVGLLVLGRVRGPLPEELLPRLASHPSCLGWLLAEAAAAPAGLPPGALVGSESLTPPVEANFFALPASQAGQHALSRPVLWLGAGAAGEGLGVVEG